MVPQLIIMKPSEITKPSENKVFSRLSSKWKTAGFNKAKKQEFLRPSFDIRSLKMQEFSILCCSLLDCTAEFFGLPGTDKHSFSGDQFQDYNRVDFFGRL
jgi:hypothetical protein